jgi:hypothetical protein
MQASAYFFFPAIEQLPRLFARVRPFFRQDAVDRMIAVQHKKW